MPKNEDGLTLVELLAALALLSMVVILIWTAFFISSRHNATETKRLHMQQEANSILTIIQQEHRKRSCYRLDDSNDQIKILECNSSNYALISSSTNFVWKVKEITEDAEDNLIEEDIDSNRQIHPESRDLSLKLIVMDRNNERLRIEVETTISRYRSY